MKRPNVTLGEAIAAAVDRIYELVLAAENDIPISIIEGGKETGLILVF